LARDAGGRHGVAHHRQPRAEDGQGVQAARRRQRLLRPETRIEIVGDVDQRRRRRRPADRGRGARVVVHDRVGGRGRAGGGGVERRACGGRRGDGGGGRRGAGVDGEVGVGGADGVGVGAVLERPRVVRRDDPLVAGDEAARALLVEGEAGGGGGGAAARRA